MMYSLVRIRILILILDIKSPGVMEAREQRSSSKKIPKDGVSVPEELNQEQRKKKFEDLRMMPFSLNDDGANLPFPTPQKKRKKKRRGNKRSKILIRLVNNSIVSITQQNVPKEALEGKSVELEGDEAVLSQEIELASCEDYSQLFQSFDIFDKDQLFSQPENQLLKDLERNNKSNNMIDQANLYLNLSSKITPIPKEEKDALELKTNAEILRDKKLCRGTTLKTGHFTGANVT